MKHTCSQLLLSACAPLAAAYAPSLFPGGQISALSPAMLKPALLVPRQRAELLRHSPPQALTGGDPGVPSDDDEGITKYYRTLGIPENADYDEIMNAHMALIERYAGQSSRLADIETAKEKVLDDRLRRRMSGSLRPEVADSPFDENPTERIMPWVPVSDTIKKLFTLPPRSHVFKVLPLMGGLVFASWVSPSIAGTAMLMNTVSAIGFLYNQGTPEVRRDDMGQVGEIRPTQTKPMILAFAITAVPYAIGYIQAKRYLRPQWLPEMVLRVTFCSIGMILTALFMRVQGKGSLFP
jgi:hypothetical protein